MGDASAYGIYFDDESYNYMQHLRPVGAMDSYLIEAPKSKKEKSKSAINKGDELPGFNFKDLPEDVLPSHPLDEISYTKITENIATATVHSLQPDLNQNIRQVLEALSDEEFAVDDGNGTDGEDEFWNEVVKGGEKQEWELEEEEENYSEEENDVVAEPEGWEQRVARFKKESKMNNNSDDEDEEDGDTIADLRLSNAKRPKRKANSTAGSQFSMTSSAMFRNEGLQTLDEQFDQVSIDSIISILTSGYPSTQTDEMKLF